VRVRRIWLGSVPITPGLYGDPGGAGIRQWSGTEWSPFLQRYRADHRSATGFLLNYHRPITGSVDPAPTWSPLAPDVQQAQWGLAIKAPAEALTGIVLYMFFALMFGLFTAFFTFGPPDIPPAATAVGALMTVGVLVGVVGLIRTWPARRRIAKAAKQALALASAQDKPTQPEPSGA
jgi:hypothetical protein